MPGGSDPLVVVVPIFSVKKIAQSSPVVEASNRLFVTLTTNADLEGASDSTIDIQGFDVPDRTVSPFPVDPTFSSPAGMVTLHPNPQTQNPKP